MIRRHPILGRARDLGLYLVALACGGVLLAKLALPVDPPSAWRDLGPWRDAIVLGLPLGLAMAGLGMAAWWLHGGIVLRPSALPRWLLTQAAISALAVYASAELMVRYGQREAQWWIVALALYLLATLLHYLADQAAVARRAESRAGALQVRARDAKLKAFKAQIDPHFLFNSLNSLSALCGFDPTGARRMALLLAGFFRGSVDAGRKDWLPLGEELSLMEKYLEIEKVRFEDRLEVELEVSVAARSCLIPSFLLQPLIENAVKHGIASLVEGGVVRLGAGWNDGRLEIEVENPRDPDSPKSRGAGTGLANVQGRLLTLYGPEARFEIDDTDERFQVSLSFPASQENSKEMHHG